MPDTSHYSIKTQVLVTQINILFMFIKPVIKLRLTQNRLAKVTFVQFDCISVNSKGLYLYRFRCIPL